MLKNIQNVLIYTVSGMFAKFLTLLTIPIVARNLTIEAYGQLTILISVILLIQSTFLFGFEHSLNYYFNKFRKLVDQQLLVSTQLIFICTSYLLTSVFVSILFFSKVEYIYFILIWGFLSVLLAYFGALLKVDMRPIAFVKGQILQSVSILIAMHVFIYVFQLGMLGVLYANILSIVIFLICVYFYTKKYVILRFDIELFKKVLRYGLPLMPSGVILWASTQLDRYYILYFLDEYFLGVYGFAISIAMIFLLLKMSVKSAIDPFVMKAFHRRETQTKNYISDYLTLNIYVFSFLFIVLSIFSNELAVLLGGDKYTESGAYIPWVLFVTLITTFNQYFIYGINFKKKNNLIFIGLVYMLTVNILLAYALIDEFKVYGVIWANLIANILYTIYLYKKSDNLYPIKHNTLTNTIIIFSSLGLYVLIEIYFKEGYYTLKILLIFLFIILNVGPYRILRRLMYG